MTGPAVLALRSALKLTPAAFADFCGVHASTVYRWEKTPGALTMEHGALRLFMLLEHYAQTAVPGELQHTIQMNGGLYGVYTVLQKRFAGVKLL